MTRAFVACLLVLCAAASPRLASQSPASQAGPSGSSAVATCLAAARARAEKALEHGSARTAARQQLEIQAAACFDPTLPPSAARIAGIVSSDRARFARDFLEGTLTLATYRAALEDRQGKLARLLKDPKAQQALRDGDADGDLVPDDVDHCPKTRDAEPTDERGCPRRPAPSGPAARDDKRLERQLRETLAGARFLYNPSCEGGPRPQIPVPLEWGRGPQTKHKTTGFNFAVAKVGGQPAGCEIFYEIQFRFIDPNPGNPSLPKSKIVTVVYSASEDLLTDSRRAVFGIPMLQTVSPARAEAREAFAREYFRASWRVRAVTGSNKTSPWSAFVTQGPASSGVNG